MNVLDATPRCRALVAGFGRPGMRDLDFGRQLIRYLEGLPWDEGVVVEDLSYAAPLVLHRLQELEPAKVVLVGAAARGFEVPGSLRRYRLNAEPPLPEEVQQSLAESAQGIVDVDHTLAVAQHYGALPAETVIIEVEPADCSFGPGFSEELAMAFDSIVALVSEELAEDSVHRQFELEPSSTALAHSEMTRSSADSRQPSAELERLIAYTRQHEHARLASRHRVHPLARHLTRDGLAAAGRSRPWGIKAVEGGDWFDVIPLEEGWFGCVIGDAPGRGVEAAAAMTDLRAAVRAYAVTDGERPASMLGRLDRLALASGLGASASLVYIAFRPSTGQLRVSNAGHCPPLMLHPDRSSEFLRVATGPRVGEGPGSDRPEGRVDVAAGSVLFLFTDGLLTSRSGLPVDPLESLRRAVAVGPSELDDLCEHVLDVYLSQTRPDDDISVLAFRACQGSGLALQESRRPPGG